MGRADFLSNGYTDTLVLALDANTDLKTGSDLIAASRKFSENYLKKFNIDFHKQFSDILGLPEMQKIGLETIHFNDSLISGEHFSQQHNPTLLPNGNLLIFNNGTAKTGSGFVELNLGNREGSATEVANQVYFKKHFPNEYYTPQMGSAQLVNDNAVLVGMGNKPLFFEVTRNGKKINWIGRTYYNDAWNSKRYNWQAQTNYRVFYYSSLFQYQFVVDTLADNRGIKIINTGTEPDTYEVLWLENDTVLFSQRVTLKPSKSIKFNRNVKKGQVRIVIKSIQSKIIKEI